MPDYSNHNFYFIRYPLGAGGAHLANLMRLDSTIAPDNNVDKNSYYKGQLTHYQNFKNNAHLPTQCIISDARWKEKLPTCYQYPASVHLGHAASFFWSKNLLDQLLNKRYIFLTFNTEQSRDIISRRENKLFGTDTLKNQYYVEEIAHWYNTWFSDQNQIDDDINLPIETNMLFDKNIEPVIQIINQKYQLHIPINQAQELHNYWTKIVN